MDSLSIDGSSVSTADSGFDENSTDSSMITPGMTDEQLRIQRALDKDCEKQRREYEKERYDEDIKALRYKRLMHLLKKSEFYAGFMHQKVETLLSEKKSKKRGTKRKAADDLVEEYSEEITRACKKFKDAEGIEQPTVDSEDQDNKLESFNSSSSKLETNNKNVIKTNENNKEKTRLTNLGIWVPAEQPKLLEGTALRDYQLDGLSWLKLLFETGMNGILADEMGLGKTVQVIALICHLYEQNTRGPFLIVGPLSTLPNWAIEFSKFAPEVPVILYHGIEKVREELRVKMRKKVIVNNKKVLPVVLTSYEIPIRDEAHLRRFTWKYIIVDEGHRLKNYKTQLSRTLKSFSSINRLLLTGTPLQNNLTELWSLLHFLLPDIFDSLDAFQTWFHVEDIEKGNDIANKLVEQEKKDNVLSTLHKILTPFLLRRVKSEVNLFLPPKKEVIVYCPLSPTQRKLYETILDRSILDQYYKRQEEDLIIPDNPDGTKIKRKSALRKEPKKKGNRRDESSFTESESPTKFSGLAIVNSGSHQYCVDVRIRNVQMALRKTVNHPYLIQMPVHHGSKILKVDEKIVTESGKVTVLDGLLKRLKERKHKVLIFSTFTTVLDLLEEVMEMRGYDYERLDGMCSLESRKASIYRFNSDENVFVFLISTRAGGLGINLTAADTAIIYDSDWNPQADLQAQDRCHRIGQTRPVIVYRLVTEATIDEKIVSRGVAKRKLEKLIIHSGQFNNSMVTPKTESLDLEELRSLLTSKQHEHELRLDGSVLKENEWDVLLDRSDLIAAMPASSD